MQTRSLMFRNKEHGRYWWFKTTNAKYVPPVFEFLTDAEWQIISSWYDESERRFATGTGECNVSAMCMLMGIIMGNNISRLVQCGHHIGFSTLLLGFMLRRMGHPNGLISFDINREVTDYTDGWIKIAGLQDFVSLHLGDSAGLEAAGIATRYLRGKPQIVFVDSSHQYEHTVRELDLWFDMLQPGGFIVLHDVSNFASTYDSTSAGGVSRAVAEWKQRRGAESIAINGFCTERHFGDLTVYKDAAGLGLIQKPS